MNMLTKVANYAVRLVTGAFYLKSDGTKEYVPKDEHGFLNLSSKFMTKDESETAISDVVDKLDTSDKFDDDKISARIDELNSAIDDSEKNSTEEVTK
ncbi:hypothetical protein [Companilactobacillus muriivasis]|uniref:hypothetical protein n=1 Tax=Companilactobacillus muriivasis TaxID=3081444 RepID=UPI0030C69734